MGGNCEVCEVSYTSPEMMRTHLSGKKHRKKCGIKEPVEAKVPTRSGYELFPTKIQLQPVIKPTLAITPDPKPKAYELLEKQAEEAYEKYKSVATKIPLAEAQALYMEYQRIYRAYEAAYQEHMAGKE